MSLGRPDIPLLIMPDRITDLRILLIGRCPNFEPGNSTGIDLAPMLKWMDSLQSLRVSIRFYGVMGDLASSAIIFGIVAQVMDQVPADVDIKWEKWTGADYIPEWADPSRPADAEHVPLRFILNPFAKDYVTDCEGLDAIAAKWRRPDSKNSARTGFKAVGRRERRWNDAGE